MLKGLGVKPSKSLSQGLIEAALEEPLSLPGATSATPEEQQLEQA